MTLGSARRNGPLKRGSGRPPPGPVRGRRLTSRPALRVAGREPSVGRGHLPSTARPRLHRERWTAGWGPGAASDRASRGGARSARLAQRPPGTGMGAGAKMFLIPASSCLAQLHHSLLINRFLIAQLADWPPLAPRWGCRTGTLPRAAPSPSGSLPYQQPAAPGSLARTRAGPPTSASPRGRAFDSGCGGPVGVP